MQSKHLQLLKAKDSRIHLLFRFRVISGFHLTGRLRLRRSGAVNLFIQWKNLLAKAEADTVTQTLAFRVEVRRSATPLTEEVVVEMRKMAGDRGMDIMQLQNGEISYLIGKFITFETAAEYADLLKRNGYREAQVVCMAGQKRDTG